MSYIDWIESLIEIVSDDIVQTVTDVTTAIAPDGRGFLQSAQSDEEMIQDYMMLRGQPLAWGAYIMDAAQKIEQKLLDSGLPPDEIVSVHPFDIAQKYAIVYSADMEDRISRTYKKHPLLSAGIEP